MNIEELQSLYDQARARLHECREALEAAQTRIADAGDDADLDELRTAFETAAGAFDDAVAEAERCNGNLADATRRQAALDAHPAVARATSPGAVRTVEPAIYSAETSHERSFFTDAWRFKSTADPVARERLEQHGRQQQELWRTQGMQFRDVGTGAFAGLTVPQYLIDMYAPLARAGAPFLASIARKLQLPESGMTLNVSRITTGTGVAAQASENSGVQETDIDDTLLTINVRAYAGQQDVSRQAIERSEMVDAVVFADLILAYWTQLDADCLNADGTNGTHLGVRNSGGITKSYTDASPTLGELYPKVADAIQTIASLLFRPATTVFMHPRRWGWATSQLDSNGRPLVVPDAQGPFNALAVGDAPDYGAVVGSMQGLPVVTDANIVTTNGAGTNEDQIFAERMPEVLFWQDGDGNPRQLTFEQSNAPQSIRLAVWGYSAFSAARYPNGNAVISGTGLVTPTF